MSIRFDLKIGCDKAHVEEAHEVPPEEQEGSSSVDGDEEGAQLGGD
jgi:hypothetical protein